MKISRKKIQAGQSGNDGENFRNIELKIRLNEKEFLKIKSKLDKSQEKILAKFCREILLLKTDGVSISQSKNQTTEILYALSKIGNNINQIARRLNIEKNIYSDLANELKNELENLKRIQIKGK